MGPLEKYFTIESDLSEGPILCVDISSDGKLMATGSVDGKLSTWDLDFGGNQRIVSAHDHSVMAVQFVRNTRASCMFSVGKDGLVKYWKADTLELLLTLEGHHGGVWCLAISNGGDFVITGSHDRSSDNDIWAIGWGYATAFGYDQVNNDYKVIRISRKLYQIELYSMRGNSWRKVKEEWPLTESSSILGYPAFSNGAVHWMVTFVHRMVATMKIVAFDLSIEKFRVHAPLNPFLYEEPAKLNVLRGCLCFCIHNQVWVMKEYRKLSSWTLLYKLQRSFSFCESYVFSHNGEEVLTSALNKRSSFKLFWYHIKKKTSRIVKIQNSLPTSFCTIICQGSLLRP